MLTASTESVLITAAVDTHGDWDMGTFEKMGRNLHTEIYEDVIVLL